MKLKLFLAVFFLSLITIVGLAFAADGTLISNFDLFKFAVTCFLWLKASVLAVIKRHPGSIVVVIYILWKERKWLFYYVPRLVFAIFKTRSYTELKRTMAAPVGVNSGFGIINQVSFTMPENLGTLDYSQLHSWFKRTVLYHGNRGEAITFNFTGCLSINKQAVIGLEKFCNCLLELDVYDVSFVFKGRSPLTVSKFRTWLIEEHSRLEAQGVRIKVVEGLQYINNDGSVDFPLGD